MKRPEEKTTPKLNDLRAAVKEYLDFLQSDEYHEDSLDNYRRAIFKQAVEAFYGDAVWEFVNERMK